MKLKLYFIITFVHLTVSKTDLNYVSDTIQDDVKFYYRKLTKYPSKSATINFSFICMNSTGGLRLELYTRDNHLNIQRKCSWIHHEQLQNEKLNIFVGHPPDCRRKSGSTVCEGTRIIQDYLPRHYYFSFGIKCSSKIGSLKGLLYNISISGQSNHTDCSVIPRRKQCSNYYSHTSLPNLIGGNDLRKIIPSVKKIPGISLLFKGF